MGPSSPGPRAGGRRQSGAAARADGRPADLSEAEWDRILPPIDEEDPEWQAYVRRKVRQSLDDPRPSVPAEEVRRYLRELHEARLKREAKN
jgi:antitoxin ParD1/3/4